ncbi:MAG TPA: hypothetical protein VFW25_01360 [Silvibacterium sp.]|nr:hypothetical protein [Silvibacterium sp.]
MHRLGAVEHGLDQQFGMNICERLRDKQLAGPRRSGIARRAG